jgi:TatD DNase family protein
VDSHCHLQLAKEDPERLLERAAEAGVAWVVVPGTDADTSRRAAELAVRFPDRVVATAGLHPHDAARWPEERETVAALAAGAAAVGETGLDLYRNLSPPDAQAQAFLDQLRIAEQLDKPVVVHCRDAFAEVYEHLEVTGMGARSILHCWTGGPRWTRRFDDLGVTFSFAGPVAFETGDTVRRGAEVAPRERAMVETDTPYLSPPPHRGEANEPARVVLVGAALAQVWGVAVDQVARITADRAGAVFGRG